MDTTIQLTGYLEEFRQALLEEIKATENSSLSNAIALSDGQRMSQVGKAYQYLFTIDSALSLPGDVPGELHIPGFGGQIDATIVSVQGLKITLSISVDAGHYIAKAKLQTNLAFLMKKLIERIEACSAKQNTPGERLLGWIPVAGSPEPIEISDLNPEQTQAVGSAIGRDTTFIWGPPGTGKTQTIGAAAERLYRLRRTVLLVSHTNTAVDAALLKVADALGDDLKEGEVLRVGVSQNEKLNNHPYLLLHKYVEKHSEELVNTRKFLLKEKENKIAEVVSIQRMIDIYKWVREAEKDINNATLHLLMIQKLDKEAWSEREHLSEMQRMEPEWKLLAAKAHEALNKISNATELSAEISHHEFNRAQLQQEVEDLSAKLIDAELVLRKSQEIEPSRRIARSMLTLETLQSQVLAMNATALQYDQAQIRLHAEVQKATQLYERSLEAGALTRLWKGLPKAEDQRRTLESLQKELEEVRLHLRIGNERLSATTNEAKQRATLDKDIQNYAGIPDLEYQTQVVNNLNAKRDLSKEKMDGLDKQLSGFRISLSALEDEIQKCTQTYHESPYNVAQEIETFLQEIKETRRKLAIAESQASKMRAELEEQLSKWLEILSSWNLSSKSRGSAEYMLSEVRTAHKASAEALGSVDLDDLLARRNQANEEITVIETKVSEIDERLKSLEENVIKEAKILATTLTRAYLRDAIQSRRFDTVILDEASMAPIPALWLVAALADKSVVVVGDFKQLPPIAISQREMAQKWLARDIFEASGIMQSYNEHKSPPHFVILKDQYRMHPHISGIVNTLIYGEQLVDKLPDVLDEQELADWYQYDWGRDEPVILLDTRSVGAWVTSVAKAGSPSRLNFLSATISVDLAELLLRKERARRNAAEKASILIVCPYAPHAKLLRLLIRDQELQDYVEAGTAHSFQGNEASVVILDLVNDEPHWRVNLFNPKHDESNRRLINVAITRARRRLIIVGNFDYCEKLSKKAFLGGEFIPLLRKRFSLADALKVVPAGLAARAAKSERRVHGGFEQANVPRIVLTQKDFYTFFLTDLAEAKERIVIYSPFATFERVGMLQPHLTAANERGVNVYVVTKSRSDRSPTQLNQYRKIERSLQDWGVIVVHKQRMHEKLVFIDDDIVWSGSLNPLSHSDTQEIMERRESRQVVQDFIRTLCMEELLEEYGLEPPTCPICGKEMVAAEGRNDPFYWRCIEEDCYSRSIDDVPLTDGRLKCQNCASDVEFGEWGGKLEWRCKTNRHHHQRLHRNHLRLPKMRQLIPAKELRRLDKEFELTSDNGIQNRSGDTQGQFDFK